MDTGEKIQEAHTVFSGKDKNVSASQYTNHGAVYRQEMTVSQANAIMALLPKGYSIHADRSIKHKRTVKKTFKLDTKSKEFQEAEDFNFQNNASMKEQSFHNLSYSEMLKKCHKILTSLKKNKNSWPFLEPVDPIALGIPHYRQIVQEPMDLATVTANLSEEKYASIAQFYADIELIISNSLLFNRSNVDFCKITNDFKKYFDRLVSEPTKAPMPAERPKKRKLSKSSNFDQQSPRIQKIKSQQKQFLMISEKKQLAMKIKCLPLKNIIEIAQLVTERPVSDQLELNLETLSVSQLRKIQEYINNLENSKGQPEPKKDNEIERGDESSFQSCSDS